MTIPAFDFSAFPKINPTLFITMPVLVGVLVFFFVAYTIISGVLVYHWSAYGMKSHAVFMAETLFLFVSIILFVTASLSLYYF
jgi:hypothetical protein